MQIDPENKCPLSLTSTDPEEQVKGNVGVIYCVNDERIRTFRDCSDDSFKEN